MTLSASNKVKRVLVVTYSQSGQLSEIGRRIMTPLTEAGISVHVETLRPVKPYPFPWGIFSFFDAFPECAHLVPPELEPLTLRGDEDFDLVILPYQVWFLAPALPMSGFLQHPIARKLLANKPVITVIACRNMWMLAHEKMKGMLHACGARLLDNVVLIDPHASLVTLATAPAWLLSGQRDFIKFLPPAGVDAASIANAGRFGRALRDALLKDEEHGTAPLLAGLGAVNTNPHLLVSEKAGTRSFYVWGKLLRAVGEPGQWRRRPLLVFYIVFLIALILTVVPLSLLLQALLQPMLRQHFAKQKVYYDAPSGCGTERMQQYGDA